jgi:hypothetical protein
MACLQPNGDCQSVGCAGCSGGCAGQTPQPFLPRCQNVTLAPGVYAYATVTVNDDGCISSVAAGAAPLYTPDDCCAPVGGGGGAGLPGGQGLPGTAATVSVAPIVQGSGSSWSVTNIGTASAAVFQFTAPAPTVGGGAGAGGFTGEVAGMDIANGLVQQMPLSLVTDIQAQKLGATAPLYTFQAVPALTPEGLFVMQLGLDGFHANLTAAITAAQNALQAQIDNIVATVAALNSAVAALDDRVTVVENATAVQGNDYIIWNNLPTAVTVGVTAGPVSLTIGVPANGTAFLPAEDTDLVALTLATVTLNGMIVHAYMMGPPGGSGSGGGA